MILEAEHYLTPVTQFEVPPFQLTPFAQRLVWSFLFYIRGNV